MASYRKKNKISTVREQNAEAMVPYRDDLEKIKEIIHEVNEAEVARPSLPQFCVAAIEVNETEAVDFSEQRERIWCGQPGCELVCGCAYYNSERTRETGFQESERKTIHDVNEAEVAAPEVNETEAAGMSREDFKEYLEACCESSDEEVNETNVMWPEHIELRKKYATPHNLYWDPIWQKKNFTSPKSVFFNPEYVPDPYDWW